MHSLMDFTKGMLLLVLSKRKFLYYRYWATFSGYDFDINLVVLTQSLDLVRAFFWRSIHAV